MIAHNGLDPKCPFVGLKDDPDTSLDYPSTSNYCHNSRPLSPISLRHQETCCLTRNHSGCPIYSQAKKIHLPQELRAFPHQHKRSRRAARKIIFYLLLVIGVIGLTGALIVLWQRQSLEPSNDVQNIAVTTNLPVPSTPTPAPILTFTGVPTASPTITLTPTPHFTPTSSPSPSATQPVRARKVRALDQKIGSQYQFVIHKSLAGESMLLYANQLATSLEAIKAINYQLPFPFWENSIIIIPVGFQDVTGLPKFEAYMVEKEGLSVEEIAQSLEANPALMRLYNNLGNNYRSLQGDWLLVPRIVPTPTP